MEIIDSRTPRELLFDGSGAWVYTKTEVWRSDVPRTVMQALESSVYASYRIDDIDHYKTPDKEFYRFDLESAQGDAKVDVAPDGTLALKQPGSDPGQGNAELVNTTVAEFISSKYPGAQILGQDYDDGLLEVEIWHEGREKEVYFNGRSAWVRTAWDIRRGELPQAVTAAIAASEWAAFPIDDIGYVQTPTAEYYLVELERGEREIELRIDAGGTIL